MIVAAPRILPSLRALSSAVCYDAIRSSFGVFIRGMRGVRTYGGAALIAGQVALWELTEYTTTDTGDYPV